MCVGFRPTALRLGRRQTRDSLGLMGLVRRLLIFKLGALVGMVVAAAFFKRIVRSRGDAESDELALVAILDGVQLKSKAKAFRGGSMLAWFGGIEADLSAAELAPGAHLSVHALFGGIEVKTPATWRIESEAKAVMGGIDDKRVPPLVGAVDSIGSKPAASVPNTIHEKATRNPSRITHS